MIKIILAKGESVRIEYEDIGGAFELHYDTKEHPNATVVKEVVGMDGNIKGTAFDIMHEKRFGPSEPDKNMLGIIASEASEDEEDEEFINIYIDKKYIDEYFDEEYTSNEE